MSFNFALEKISYFTKNKLDNFWKIWHIFYSYLEQNETSANGCFCFVCLFFFYSLFIYFICAYVCVCICIYVCVCVCECVCMYVCMYVYIVCIFLCPCLLMHLPCIEIQQRDVFFLKKKVILYIQTQDNCRNCKSIFPI